MKQQKEISGLNPKDFYGKKVLCELVSFGKDKDCLRWMDGNKQKELAIVLQHPVSNRLDDYVIKYLFGKTLNPLVEAFGDDSSDWLGKRMEITSHARRYKDKTGKDATAYDWEFIPDTSEIVKND